MQHKEILIITNYFPPESGAASNRINSMVNGFYKNNYTVSVVCPFPNYPDGKTFKDYRGSILKKTEEPFGTLFRLWIWPTKSKNKFVRLLSMISFSLSLMIFLIFKKTPKKVVIQYSPVFVGFTAVFWTTFLRKKIILNVSDLWPLAGLEMGLLQKGFYYNILSKMEKFCYKKSHLILGQSEEILTHIQSFEINSPLFLYRNYPDFYTPQLNIDEVKNEIKIVYAGLLGVAQGLYKICSDITFTKNISLHIYGSGPETELIKMLKKPNIYYYGAIERELLHKELLNCDIGFVPLINRIYGSVPSKIFELSRLGLPILYFAGGEGEDIVTDNNLGWNIPVADYEKLQFFIDSFSKDMLVDLSKNNIQTVSKNRFSFEKQFDSFIKKIESI
tara:strand:- start:646 stop:1812 length:1167 start_codon:yes stop_codon:yes gene_type:complete